jgi:integrase
MPIFGGNKTSKKMATVKFFIKVRGKNANDLQKIYVRFKHGKNEVDQTATTKYQVSPEDWNPNKQEVRQKATAKDKDNINTDLRNLSAALVSAFNNRKQKDSVPTGWLKTQVDLYFYGTANEQIELNGYVYQFIKDIESGQRLTDKNQRYKLGTIKNFKGFKVQFDLFQEKQRRKYDFSDIDMDFYSDYVGFFTQKNYSPNTIGRHIKSLKVIMRAAKAEKLHSSNDIDQRAFKITTCDVQNIYLTEQEIKAMFDLDLSNSPALELARNVFLVGCYTAQRFSDYSTITKNNIRKLEGSGSVVDLKQKKTGERVIIPVRPELEYILSKYDYTLPHTWEQKINEHIKKVGRLAKIKELVSIEEIKGGLKVKKDVAKCDLIKTHTARRSGATNMYLAGISTIDIMKITGHKTEREFLKYIKVTKEQTAQTLIMHPYFSNPVMKVSK